MTLYMTLYKASTKYLYSEIDSEAVILDVNSGTYFGLNEVSNRIWQLLQTPTSQQQLLENVMEEYEVTEAEAVKDIQSLLKELLDQGLVEVANEEVAQVN